MNPKFPNPTLAQISKLCTSEYNLPKDITISRLPGESPNYLITTGDEKHVVLKIAGSEHTNESIKLQHHIFEQLHDAGLSVNFPRIIPNKTGDIIAVTSTKDNSRLRAYLLKYVRGIPWNEAGTPSRDQLHDFGKFLGKFDLALNSIDHPATHRTHSWDLTKAMQHRRKAGYINEPVRRQILEWFFHFYAACAVDHLAILPHSLIHADANDENVLVTEGRVSGLLDFSDCLYNPTICELAIALAYMMLDQPDPLGVGAEIVKSYNSIRQLSNEELAVLYPLICGRLCVTLTTAAERRRIKPDHPNWFVTEERAWDLIEQLYEIDPLDAGKMLTSKIEQKPFYDTGESPERLLKKRAHFIGPSLSISYRQPLKIVQGRGQYLFDHRGRPFLDLVNNVCHVGHCHPRVVEAAQKQMAVLNTNTRYLYDGLTEYAQRLCSTLPDRLDTCFFVNSGSEANELALRLAMTHTGRRDFVVVDSAYHGNTSKLIEISPYKFMGEGGRGKPESWVHIVPIPDGYRGKYKGDGPSIGTAYGDEVGRVISQAEAPIAGFITESMLGCGGQIIPPKGFLQTAFQHVRASGGLCIIDEVQVGFGRIGSHFWAFERQNVIPDIVVMGKPIGNGHPMAAIVTTSDIAASFANGMEFFSTFGGNPVSCAIGLAVLDVIQEEGLQKHALELGSHFLQGLQGLIDKHAIIGDVRGAGLFIGVEFVQDRYTLAPAAKEANEFIQEMKNRGILLSTDGPFHNVIKIKPPMVLNIDDVDMVLRAFDDVLSSMEWAGQS